MSLLIHPPRKIEALPFVVGIDFGTTTCLAAWVPTQDQTDDVAQAELIPLSSDLKPHLESIVTYTEAGYRAGALPDNLSDKGTAVVIRSIKRELEKISVQHPSYPNAQLWKTPSGDFNCIQVAGHLFLTIRNTIERRFRQAIAGAVITVPAYFGERARNWIRKAAESAGLRVLRLLSEPTAAALAFSPQRSSSTRYVGVYDLGGGTFDCSILSITGSVFEVLATIGDTKLGGDDFDHHIVSWLNRVQGADSTRASSSFLARSIKERLSAEEIVTVGLEKEETLLSRAQFNQWIHDSIVYTIDLVKHALREAAIKPEQLESFLLVGGSTKTPYIAKLISEYIPPDKLVILNQPQAAVALGAAVHARSLVQHADNLLLLDVTPFPLGIETFGGEVEIIIPANSLLPIVETRRFRLGHSKQEAIEIHVVQADHELASQCTSLGRFTLFRNADTQSPRALDTVSITFNLDIDSVLTVSATLTDGPERAEFSIQWLTEQGAS